MYFTWGTTYIYISLHYSQKVKYFYNNCRAKQTRRFTFNNFFLENRAVYEKIWEKYGGARQATDDIIEGARTLHSG
jgi:hypothetical protein